MLLVPPRHGKSELASIRFPAWHLGHHPEHEIINAGYNLDLPMVFSRKVREMLRDKLYSAIFPASLIDADTQSAERWLTTQGGGFTAAGVGGGITGKGAHCLGGETLVSTVDGPLAIERLYLLSSLPAVSTPLGPRRILAVTRRTTGALYRLRFASGAQLRATGEHPVYLPDERRYATVEELYGTTQKAGGAHVRVVRERISASVARTRESGAVEVHRGVLREGLQPGAPRAEAPEAMPYVLPPGNFRGRDEEREVLRAGVQAEAFELGAEDLRAMRRGVSAAFFEAGLLHEGLRGSGAQPPDDRRREFTLQDGTLVRVAVRQDAQRGGDSAGHRLRGVRGAGSAGLPPHRRGRDEQRAVESGDAVSDLPRGAPQVQYDAISVVERVGEDAHVVYDLQVEDAGCFFAAGVLTGNCLIIDDPIKNMEEADSQLTRDNLWSWYWSTARTRLAPGGGVLVIECMTGDTPVLLPDGTERRLDALRAGDRIATYADGRLAAARVAAQKSSGRDLVYRITTSSGRIVRANGRHPFLVLGDEGLVWVRTQGLNTTHGIVTVPGSGGSGAGSRAPLTDAVRPPSAAGSATRTTSSGSGLPDTGRPRTTRKLRAPATSSTATASPPPSTPHSWLRRAAAALCATSLMRHLRTGATASASTTTTLPGASAACCATPATSPQDSFAVSGAHSPWPSTFEFTTDPVLSVEPDGEEEVFDLQVEGTENFIAGGLVSHNTWWNDDDLAGRLLKQMETQGDAEEFEVVKYPALAEAYEFRHKETLQIARYLPQVSAGPGSPELEDAAANEIITRTAGGWELLRRPGDALHEGRYDAPGLRRLQANMPPRIWSALYQQNPMPDTGLYFRQDYFQTASSVPQPHTRKVFTAWDFAIGQKQVNDFTVGATILQDYDDSIHVLDIERFKEDSFTIVERILDTAKRYMQPGVSYELGFEDGQIWRSIEPLLLRRAQERRMYPVYKVMKPLTDKMARARPLQGRMQQKRVWFPADAPWLTDCRHELLRFPGGAHDDIVDALAWAFHMVVGSMPPTKPRNSGGPQSWKERLTELIGMPTGTHMSS